jgi:excisionase family DNA binding protein
MQDQQQDKSLMLNTTAAAARKLGVSRSTVKRWIRNGRLETVEIDGRTWVRERSLMKIGEPTPADLRRREAGAALAEWRKANPPIAAAAPAPNPPEPRRGILSRFTGA